MSWVVCHLALVARAPRELLLDKTHYPSLLLFRKVIIPSITGGLSDNWMNMPSHRLITQLLLRVFEKAKQQPMLLYQLKLSGPSDIFSLATDTVNY